jgi:hypothetical protein
MQDHHLLDAEAGELDRVKEFLSYVKTPEKHERMAADMLDMMAKVWVTKSSMFFNYAKLARFPSIL